MEERQAQLIDEAARRFAEALAESYKAALNHTSSAKQLNAELVRKFFESVTENLRTQAEDIRASSQELAEQAQQQQEATQGLAQASVEAYMKLMDNMFSYYRLLVASRSKRL